MRAGMLFLAEYQFGTRLENKLGHFSYLVEAVSQEQAELKLTRLLEEAVKDEKFIPAPCRILLGRLAVLERIPQKGLIHHYWIKELGDIPLEQYLPLYLPEDEVTVLYDWNNEFADGKCPVPLIFVDRDRKLTFPTESTPPYLW
jgi:hypothetical protein